MVLLLRPSPLGSVGAIGAEQLQKPCRPERGREGSEQRARRSRAGQTEQPGGSSGGRHQGRCRGTTGRCHMSQVAHLTSHHTSHLTTSLISPHLSCHRATQHRTAQHRPAQSRPDPTAPAAAPRSGVLVWGFDARLGHLVDGVERRDESERGCVCWGGLLERGKGRGRGEGRRREMVGVALKDEMGERRRSAAKSWHGLGPTARRIGAVEVTR
ncbi:hypothetical protein JHW43_003798 [Diplocarpon mali]|nr:hypothetical protein JHW43_003798 [Diplocarpon mali]